MKKRLFQIFALALCLCMLLPMSAAATTGEIVDITDRNGESRRPPRPSDPPPPPPEPEASYIITIAAPRGWHRRAATVTIRLEDVNKTGFAKAEARFGQNGSWQDISDSLRAHGWAHVEISDNGTVFVSITDRTGKAHVRSLYLECFDREAPTVRARVDGHTLRVEADDAHSGVEFIFVNGHRFDDHNNGFLDIRIRDYVDRDEEEIFVYAVDFAGNRSRTVTVKNPNYTPPSSSQPATPPPAATTPPATTTPPAASTPPPAAAAPPAASTPSAAPPAQPAQPRPESITPTDGTGTVIENSHRTPDEREFFTIDTEAGNTFYIVVDKQKTDRNVYLLSEVTEADLMGLARQSEPAPPPEPPAPPAAPEMRPQAPAPELPPEQPPTEPEPQPEQEQPEAPKSGGNIGTIAIVIVLFLAVGGAGYYFKIVRPRQEMYYDEDEDESGETSANPENAEDDAEDDDVVFDDPPKKESEAE